MEFAQRKLMKLHRFLMCTIFHIHNVTVVARRYPYFHEPINNWYVDGTKFRIRNNQHIQSTLLVNLTTSVLFAGTRPCRYSDYPAPQPYKRPSMLTMVAALALVQGRGRWPPTYGPGRQRLDEARRQVLALCPRRKSSQATRRTSSPTSVTTSRSTSRIWHRICSGLGSVDLVILRRRCMRSELYQCPTVL